MKVTFSSSTIGDSLQQSKIPCSIYYKTSSWSGSPDIYIMFLLLTTPFRASDIPCRRRRSIQSIMSIVPEGVACTAMTLTTSLVLLCLVGEITCPATPALDSCTFKLLDVPTNDDHSMKEKQACPPVASYKLHSTSTIDVVNADQVGAADYSLSHSYMTATSDVCITTDLVIDAAPPVHTTSADFMIFPADGITSRNVTISVFISLAVPVVTGDAT